MPAFSASGTRGPDIDRGLPLGMEVSRTAQPWGNTGAVWYVSAPPDAVANSGRRLSRFAPVVSHRAHPPERQHDDARNRSVVCRLPLTALRCCSVLGVVDPCWTSGRPRSSLTIGLRHRQPEVWRTSAFIEGARLENEAASHVRHCAGCDFGRFQIGRRKTAAHRQAPCYDVFQT